MVFVEDSVLALVDAALGVMLVSVLSIVALSIQSIARFFVTAWPSVSEEVTAVGVGPLLLAPPRSLFLSDAIVTNLAFRL